MNTLHLNQIGDKVIVKKGEGGGGSASSWRYFDISSLSDSNKAVCAEIGMIVKTSVDIILIGTVAATKDFSSVICFGVDSNTMVTIDEQLQPISIVLDMYNPALASMGAVEITEEEFYTL